MRMCADMRTTMAKTRAIMTDTERERLAGLDDVEDIKVYQAKSRVRRRIEEELTFDVEILEEHHPDLLEELRDVVCEAAPARQREREDTGRERTPAPTEHDLAEALEEEQPVTGGEDEENDLRSRMEERLNEIHIKGRPAAVAATRREALVYAWERLREEGEMQPRRLADDVLGQYFDDPDLNYSVSASGGHPGYQLLDNFLRETMMELPGVYSTGKVWQFREDDDE